METALSDLIRPGFVTGLSIAYPDDLFTSFLPVLSPSLATGRGIRISESKVSSAFFTAITDFPRRALCQEMTTSATEASSKPKKKICCACPDTKRLRDECIVEHGEAACTKWIEAHLQCLRSEGFKV
ncbi:Cytochrome c oxidase copper chaperone 2 [Cinnamomum micranthum f. kanehirae]|uniref:Cytochrome c oxidase copper chaperone 2 n=1 Tax=Cinnamomum micranthum f. kanehirae TaxID=337451 RepID=A0A3S3Q4Q1_9MAGN|nr:Cytochrome c oxidase copper chaperone 2 [Cinnamomum micranthum f. kanehirae]